MYIVKYIIYYKKIYYFYYIQITNLHEMLYVFNLVRCLYETFAFCSEVLNLRSPLQCPHHVARLRISNHRIRTGRRKCANPTSRGFFCLLSSYSSDSDIEWATCNWDLLAYGRIESIKVLPEV